MSAIGLRGHQPRNRRFTTAVAPVAADALVSGRQRNTPVSWLQIRNTSAVLGENIRVYWTLEEFTDATQYITILPGGEYEGPAEVKDFYVRSEAGTPTLESVWYYRRG